MSHSGVLLPESRPEAPGRVGSPPAPPAADHRGRVWEPSEGSHVDSQTVALMLVRVGGRWFAIDARMIEEVAVKGTVTRVPTAARHVLGVAGLRGGVVPVISLQQMIGIAGAATTELATTLPRLVVVRAGDCELALVVDEIRGIIADHSGADAAQASGAERPSFLRREFEWQGKLVGVLDVAQLAAAAAGSSQGGA
jgi:chemotaxis signal transduction protein